MLALLPLLALAAASPPLAGCKAVLQPQPVWEYECDGLLASVADREGSDKDHRTEMNWGIQSEEHVAATSLAGAATTPGAPLRSMVKRRLAGATVQMVELEKDGRGAAMALVPRPGGTRLLACRGTIARCHAVLEALAALPWKGGPPTGVTELKGPRVPFLGHHGGSPPGCDDAVYREGGRVACGKGGVFWYAFPTEALARRKLEQLEPLSLEGISGMRSVVERCQINAVTTTCKRITGVADGGPVLVLSGIVPRGDEFLLGVCMAESTTAEIVPCSMLFGVPP